MLAGSITPRPRPPARVRRASSQLCSPPPPYLPVERSPRNDRPHFPFSANSEQWDERSREELSDLLYKADEIIRDRELELDMTSAVCKSLYEGNRELKTRHQALLARLPPSPTLSSLSGSSTPSPLSSDSQLPQSPHYYSADEPNTSSNASAFVPRPLPHHRRVSVSPADLALLSDQNAELLAQLEKLEAESIQADQAGRRKLRSLEKEIQGLRDELDKSRARSDELEQKAKVFSESTAHRDEEAERKKREREERFRALRSKTDHGENTQSEIRDFAPGGGLCSKARFAPRRRHISEAAVRPARIDELVSDERPRRVTLQTGLTRSASLSHHFRLSPPLQSPVTLTHEYALVSQLLQKIQELEETNAQITEQQARTVSQLQSVQKDATNLRLVYESLGDNGVEWVDEENETNPSAEDDEANETIRFASLRRTLSAQGSIAFSSGIDKDMQSSLKQPVFEDHVPVIAHPKVRRSVVGLFDSPRQDAASPGSSVSEIPPSVLDMMIPGLPPVPFVPQPSNTSSAASPTSPSPPLTLPQLASETFPSPVGHCPPTLDSELGAAFGGSWDGQDGNSGNFHLWTSSLASLAVLPGTEGAVSASFDLHTRSGSEQSTDSVFTPAKSLSRQSTAIQPGSWPVVEHRTVSNDSGHKPTSSAEKHRQKSETIRMRAAHWKEGRFGGTLIPAEKPGSVDLGRPSTPVPERLANAFEAIVDTMNRSKRETALSTNMGWQDDKGRSAEGSTVGVDSKTMASPPPARQRGIVAFVLEIWLWLQFVIIVFVFVWAMARRGPKSVLEEAGRRRQAP